MKTLLGKTQWKKVTLKEKEYIFHIIYTHLQSYNLLPLMETTLKVLRRYILMLCTNFSNVVVDNDFVNKSIRLSFKQIYCTMMSPFFSRSRLYKSSCEICFYSIFFNMNSFYLSYTYHVVFV